HSMALLLLSLEHYTAYSRILLLHMTSSLRMPLGALVDDEVRIAQGLSGVAEGISSKILAQARLDEGRGRRRRRGSTAGATEGTAGAAGGTAGAAGGATAAKGMASGLATPLVTAGFGSALGTGFGPRTAASLLGKMGHSSLTVGGLFGLSGARPG